MRTILQRVTSAAVRVDGIVVGEIDGGILALVGIERGDDERDAAVMADKIANLRIFEDSAGKMNLAVGSLGESEGAVLVVSQFTLAGCVAKGRRPSFNYSAPPALARPILDSLVAGLETRGLVVEQGKFGAKMEITLINDGPATFVIECRQGKIKRRRL